jgi:hypothetical protein
MQSSHGSNKHCQLKDLRAKCCGWVERDLMALEEKFTRLHIAWILQEQWLYERRKKTRQECTVDLYICNNSLSFFSIMLQPSAIHVRKLEIWLLIDSIHSMVSQPYCSTVFNNLNIWWLFPLSPVLSSSALKVPASIAVHGIPGDLCCNWFWGWFLFYNLVSAIAVHVSGLGLVVIHSTEVGKLVSLKLHWIWTVERWSCWF